MTTITNNKLTDETLKAWKTEAIISLGETPKDCRDYSHHEAILALVTELQECRKADSAEPDYIRYDCGCCGWETIEDWRESDVCPKCNHKPMGKTELYTTPPASERERIRREHAEWSDKTFGDVGPVGPLKHLSKEALEAAADPSDPLEWADMQFLLWDAQRRAGISDGEITLAMKEKLAVNKKREWPEPKDGEPRLHIKEQPAQVVPEEMPKGLAGQIVSLLAHNIGDKFLAQKIWNTCRAAMLQGKFLDLSQPVDPQVAKYEQIMLQAGWVMVPIEPTDEMIAAAMECDDVVFDSKDPTAFCVQYREIYCAMVDVAPKPEDAND